MPEAGFNGLAARLPRFAPGATPADDQGYLRYYDLNVELHFPACTQSFGTIDSGEHRIAVQSWQIPQAKGTLYLLHGYFDHVGLYGHMLRYGLSRSCNVVAFDLPGHGLSSGPRAEITDFVEYRQALTDVLAATAFLDAPRHVVAQSTGGAVIMDFLQVHEPIFEGVVLLAPLVWPQGWRRICLAHSIVRYFIDSVPRTFAENSQDPEFLAFLREDPLQPRRIPVCWITALRRWLRVFLQRPPCAAKVFVLQGDADGTVDWRRNLVHIAKAFPNSRIETLAGARHHLVNEHQPLRDKIVAEMDLFLNLSSAASSGA